jgi:dienelactone hydrolase
MRKRCRCDTDVWVFLAENDEEVSPRNCLRALQTDGDSGKVKVFEYPGATHDFDDPGQARQSVPENRAAKEDAMRRAALLMEAFSNSASRPAVPGNSK